MNPILNKAICGILIANTHAGQEVLCKAVACNVVNATTKVKVKDTTLNVNNIFETKFHRRQLLFGYDESRTPHSPTVPRPKGPQAPLQAIANSVSYLFINNGYIFLIVEHVLRATK